MYNFEDMNFSPEEWREVAHVAVILSDNLCEKLYEQQGHYIETTSKIAGWAMEFVKVFGVMEGPRLEEVDVIWDDFVIEWGAKRMATQSH